MKTAHPAVYTATVQTQFTTHNNRFAAEVNFFTDKIEVAMKANREFYEVPLNSGREVDLSNLLPSCMENLLLRANDEIVDRHGTSWAAFIDYVETGSVKYARTTAEEDKLHLNGVLLLGDDPSLTVDHHDLDDEEWKQLKEICAKDEQLNQEDFIFNHSVDQSQEVFPTEEEFQATQKRILEKKRQREEEENEAYEGESDGDEEYEEDKAEIYNKKTKLN